MEHRYTLASLSITLLYSTAVIAQCGPSMVQTTAGDTAVYTCPGDQMEDIIELENTAPASDMFAYIVTDDDNMVLMVPGDVEMIDVEEAGIGICRVWGVTFSGDLLVEAGSDLMNTILATGCAELSDNYISIYRDVPDAGAVSVVGGGTETTVVTGDGSPAIVNFATSSTALSNYAWIITDDEGMILGVEHVPMHDFEPAGPGVCLVYGVSYTGELNAPMGEDVTMVALSDDCYELSTNYITVNRVSVGIMDGPALQPLHIFPTVVVNDFTVTLDAGQISGANMQIHDLQGRSVMEVPVTMADERIVVSAAGLAPGHYTCTILTIDGRAVGRIIKE